MINKFTATKRIKVSANSQYYAIEPLSKSFDKNPIMVIVDKEQSPQLVLSKSFSYTKNISAVIVPNLSFIDKDFCVEILNIFEDSPIELYKLPLVAESKGTVYENSTTVRIFNN